MRHLFYAIVTAFSLIDILYILAHLLNMKDIWLN